MISPILIVMKKPKTFHVGSQGKFKGLHVMRMSPCRPSRILIRHILSIVDQEVGLSRESHIILEPPAPRMPVRKLIVGKKDKGLPILYEPITHPLVGMAQRYGRDLNGSY